MRAHLERVHGLARSEVPQLNLTIRGRRREDIPVRTELDIGHLVAETGADGQ